jgi:branched-chain amino acid transport system permease protein
VLLGAGLAVVVLAVAPFVLDTYTVNILIRALLLAALALTVDILWGYTGILTFGQSAFFGIGAYACALIFTHAGFGAGWALAALAIGVLSAMAVGALVGWLAFYHGASPLYASIVTLALPIVLTQVVFAGGRNRGSPRPGPVPCSGSPAVFSFWSRASPGCSCAATWAVCSSRSARTRHAAPTSGYRCHA